MSDQINLIMARHVKDIAEACDRGIRQTYMGQSPLDLIVPEHTEPRGLVVHYLTGAERLLEEILASVKAKRRACEAQQITLVAAE